MITSSAYVHLQRPDNGDWVIVGRYTLERPETPDSPEKPVGQFVYAPSYLDAAYPWVIDPINLPRLDSVPYPAYRYKGLTDVLRDISPDAWGKLILQHEYHLGSHAHEFDYLMHAGNMDRWGALTVSRSKKPDTASILA
ncbi:hypothetical protein ED236_03210 [Pseudomethylobacillus aquaticus]|uniref:Uncharacterized protein n=1 Tax=Pseudomethylobacillus aquaticus TaxID=2676064 RepID=A0A3N0V6X2_9PROT|nr:HipA N-terminal domain-containing protein [Pseudomethylobacillus aquaticus]ROH88473.1 hypothetical protein ED236_03210 [Pseudomethylobacillus aquaticus]